MSTNQASILRELESVFGTNAAFKIHKNLRDLDMMDALSGRVGEASVSLKIMGFVEDLETIDAVTRINEAKENNDFFAIPDLLNSRAFSFEVHRCALLAMHGYLYSEPTAVIFVDIDVGESQLNLTIKILLYLFSLYPQEEVVQMKGIFVLGKIIAFYRRILRSPREEIALLKEDEAQRIVGRSLSFVQERCGETKEELYRLNENLMERVSQVYNEVALDERESNIRYCLDTAESSIRQILTQYLLATASILHPIWSFRAWWNRYNVGKPLTLITSSLRNVEEAVIIFGNVERYVQRVIDAMAAIDVDALMAINRRNHEAIGLFLLHGEMAIGISIEMPHVDRAIRWLLDD